MSTLTQRERGRLRREHERRQRAWIRREERAARREHRPHPVRWLKRKLRARLFAVLILFAVPVLIAPSCWTDGWRATFVSGEHVDYDEVHWWDEFCRYPGFLLDTCWGWQEPQQHHWSFVEQWVWMGGAWWLKVWAEWEVISCPIYQGSCPAVNVSAPRG